MVIEARYPGSCSRCGGRIKRGEKIEWSKGSGASHVKCERETDTSTPAPYHLHGGSGYGCEGWQAGQIVLAHTLNGKHVPRKTEGAKETWFFVVRASRRYVREDGMSFGVGDEEGYLYSADCREATAEESAPNIAERKIRDAKKSALADLDILCREIRETGERPDGQNEVSGKTLAERGREQQIYGGGDWIVDAGDFLWFVQNNGADGDDWSCNNVRTGGAGAIGWRVRWTDDLRARVARIVAVLGPVV